MCTEYYLDKLKDRKSKWYIDTCAVMHVEKFRKFVAKKECLINQGVAITVIKPVYEELNKKLYSIYKFESERARDGLHIIETNQDLFKIDGLDERLDVENAFADPVLHENLINNQKDFVQIIITDDQDLAYDANLLNERKSFVSNMVYACWIDNQGELVRNKGSYLNRNIFKEETVSSNDDNKTEVIKTVEIEKEIIKEVFIEQEPSFLERIGIPTFTCLGGLAAGSYLTQNKDQIIRTVMNFGKRIRNSI